MTYFPPIKKGNNESKSQPPKAKEINAADLLQKTKQSVNMQFAVSRNTVLGNDESKDRLPKESVSLSPIKASYQSMSIIKQHPESFINGGTGGVYTDPDHCYLTPQ